MDPIPAPGGAAAPTLRRAVSRWQIVGLAINDVVGSGIYLLPAAAAALLGPASLWAILVAGVAVSLLVLCYAQAASYFDQPGGSYLYAREAFGSFIGFEIGWMTWLTRITVAAALSNGLALALAPLWPAAAEGAPRVLVVVACLGFVTGVNVIGVRSGARTGVVLVIAKLLPLVAFAAYGLFHADWSRIAVTEVPPSQGLGEAALLLLFAYAGFENAPTAAGEYRDPKRDLPFALVTMIVVVTLLYVLIQAVALGTLPGLAESKSPLAEAARGFAGQPAALLMTAGAALSILGTVSNTTLFGPRYIYAVALDGFGPRSMARVHPRYRTPATAILVQSALALPLALTGSFTELALLSMLARLFTYASTAAAVPVLARRFGGRPGALRLPGGAAIPACALALSLALMASADVRNLAAAAAALAAGAVLYRFWRH